ncbi:MAG: hypothetical protein ACPHXR_05910 [Flavicella sp.]
MKINTTLYVSILLLLFSACATEEEKMNKYITGKWKTTYVSLEMPSYKNRDTLVAYNIDFLNPDDAEANAIGETFSLHNADGSFKTWQSKRGLPPRTVSQGKWRVTLDSLYYTFASRDRETTVSFGLKKIEDGFSIEVLQDRDNDGVKDDTYYSESVRVPEDNDK